MSCQNGIVTLSIRNSGPNYSYRYEEGQVDVFALYVPDIDGIAFVNATWLIKNYKAGMTLRLDKPRNGQVKDIHMFSEFADFAPVTQLDSVAAF